MKINMDKRYLKLRYGLEQLSSKQIMKILSYEKQMTYDTYNYDEINQLYWPLAVGLGVSELNIDKPMTDKLCKELIDSYGVDRNYMSGIEGCYYTNNREHDLKFLCVEILCARVKAHANKD